MGLTLTKQFVNNCRNIGALRDFLCQAIDQVDAKDKEIAELESNERRLKRALWLARAERASDRARIFYFNDLETMLDIDGFSYDSKKKKGHKKLTARRWRIIWEKVERKCRAKADK